MVHVFVAELDIHTDMFVYLVDLHIYTYIIRKISKVTQINKHSQANTRQSLLMNTIKMSIVR